MRYSVLQQQYIDSVRKPHKSALDIIGQLEGMVFPEELEGFVGTVGEPAAFRRLRLVATYLGRRGGLKGGPARARTLTAEQRTTAARHAARARWAKKAKKKQ